jgi:hypothetical protein
MNHPQSWEEVLAGLEASLARVESVAAGSDLEVFAHELEFDWTAATANLPAPPEHLRPWARRLQARQRRAIERINERLRVLRHQHHLLNESASVSRRPMYVDQRA